MAVNQHTKGRTGTKALDLPGVSIRTLKVKLPTTAASNTPASLGATIPAGSRILDVALRLAGAPTAATPLLDIGTSASADWLLKGVNISAAGTKQGSLATGAVTFGGGLSEASSASSFAQKPLVCDTEVTLGLNARSVTTALNGYVLVKYEKLD